MPSQPLPRAVRAVLLAVLPLATASAVEGVAPAAPESAGNLEAITVFGSRAQPRTVFESAVPIDVLDGPALQSAIQSGELGQALQSLLPSVNMPRASASGTSDSVRAIQLRGLAPDQVLVLVNGKRRHANSVMDIEGLFPGTVAVDLNAIPESAIDHIELLRDGAGAVYGSDAIAGVVNIVLKAGAQGGEAHASYGENRTHFAPANSNITDGRNRLLGFDYGLPFAGDGAFHFGAGYQKRGSTNRSGPTDAHASYNYTPADQALDGKIVFRSGDPELEDKNLYYNADLPLAGGGKFYSFATASWRDTEGAAFFRYPGDPSNVPAVYPNGFLPVSTGRNHDVGIVAGLKGAGEAWHWDLSAREGYNTFAYGLRNSLNASLGEASPTSFHVADFTYEERALNLDLTRELSVGADKPLNVATGLEYIHEAYHTSPGDPASYAAGPITTNQPGSQGDNGLAPKDAVHLSRSVYSAYLDLDQEVTREWLVGLAGRYSHYSDYGSSTTGKFTTRFSLSDNFLARASASTSFRAPALAQTGIRFETLSFNSAGDGLQNNAFLPPGDPLSRGLGAQALKPEKSTNLTAGLAWRSGSQFAASADVYQIRIRDRIAPTGIQPPVDPTIDPSIAGVQFLTNGLDTTTKGLDLVASTSQRLAGGSLKVAASFNRNYTREDGLRGALAQSSSETVLIPLIYGSPSTKLVLTLDYASDSRWGVQLQPTRFGTMYAFSYDSGLPTLDGANVQKYGAAWTLDASVRYSFVPGVTATLGGYNVTNRYPDRTTPYGSYYGALPYNYANPIGINGAYFYATLSVKLGKSK
jgi:iron complex outermembrane recepter protein